MPELIRRPTPAPWPSTTVAWPEISEYRSGSTPQKATSTWKQDRIGTPGSLTHRSPLAVLTVIVVPSSHCGVSFTETKPSETICAVAPVAGAAEALSRVARIRLPRTGEKGLPAGTGGSRGEIRESPGPRPAADVEQGTAVLAATGGGARWTGYAGRCLLGTPGCRLIPTTCVVASELSGTRAPEAQRAELARGGVVQVGAEEALAQHGGPAGGVDRPPGAELERAGEHRGGDLHGEEQQQEALVLGQHPA